MFHVSGHCWIAIITFEHSPHTEELTGPTVPEMADVSVLNRVFSEAFTDRYRRDGLVGVRVPQLNPDIWHYAIRDAGDGAMAWHDADQRMVAFNVAHCSGTEGWMGPLAVRTDRQGEGAGRLIVETAIEWLQTQDVTTIGLLAKLGGAQPGVGKTFLAQNPMCGSRRNLIRTWNASLFPWSCTLRLTRMRCAGQSHGK